ncbi:hypothetical protein BDV37DRAFT_296346 [Aspergillus pseudonomiae]|uniref:Metallo-beta-lactamase domain-containing protein n=1 Tax=Aspergillus pseudonomiae TaxID=1506151 RepID=A0A5N7D487_9EURO|nr:uncharacterized protein BDV37DRAFT_296346 [Aspergillus pseudonomiae]KAE8401215.1 hypothetical protein BDV37DRAFT_296346 [Aspergillus pseudonomiae]
MSPLILPEFKGSTVDVSIIHAGQITVPAVHILQSPIPGHDLLDIPCYSFLIENNRSQKVLFDLGLRKDWREKLPPTSQIESAKAVVKIEQDVADQLSKAQIPLESINTIIWSHHHMDHTGDPSLFPPSTELVVGPGFQLDKTTSLGYPMNADALVNDDAFLGRNLVELDFSGAVNIGGFLAIDFFQDVTTGITNTFKIAKNHISALARTSENYFILLGGDVAHHPGEYRPTAHLPLPIEIRPSPLDKAICSASACPSYIFENISPAKAKGKEARVTPFYELNAAINEDLENAEASLDKMAVFDGSANILIIIAHDASLLDVLPFFPKKITDWDVEGYKEAGAWRFLKDFSGAISQPI